MSVICGVLPSFYLLVNIGLGTPALILLLLDVSCVPSVLAKQIFPYPCLLHSALWHVIHQAQLPPLLLIIVIT